MVDGLVVALQWKGEPLDVVVGAFDEDQHVSEAEVDFSAGKAFEQHALNGLVESCAELRMHVLELLLLLLRQGALLVAESLNDALALLFLTELFGGLHGVIPGADGGGLAVIATLLGTRRCCH